MLLRRKAFALMAALSEKFAGAETELLEHQGQSVRIRIPKFGQENLGPLFRALHNGRAELGIGEIAISQTRLEQVFHGFAKQVGAP